MQNFLHFLNDNETEFNLLYNNIQSMLMNDSMLTSVFVGRYRLNPPHPPLP